MTEALSAIIELASAYAKGKPEHREETFSYKGNKHTVIQFGEVQSISPVKFHTIDTDINLFLNHQISKLVFYWGKHLEYFG